MKGRQTSRTVGSVEALRRSPFKRLLSDHVFLRMHLRRTMAACATQTREARTMDAVEALSRAAKVHMRAEEAVLYPACERLLGQGGSVLVLRNDHALIEATLSRPVSAPARNLVEWLYGLGVGLETHFGREERVLFPIMTALMSGGEKARLARELRSASPRSETRSVGDGGKRLM